jgi:hypothetical protein
MRQRIILCFAALLSCSPCILRAQTGVTGGYLQGLGLPPQTTTTPAVTGTVTGTVILGDTQHPARFAQVHLDRIPSAPSGPPRPTRLTIDISNADIRTGLDGTFTTTAAPGDYYVTANVLGYIQEYTVLQAALGAGANVADLAAQIPTVHVTAAGNTSAIVTLQRGAAVSGRIQWEDGSPAVAMEVALAPTVPRKPLPLPLSGIRTFGYSQWHTDDRGAFRIDSRASGDYVLVAIIYPGNAEGPVNAMMPNIQVYSPGVFRKADAKTITLHAGDDLDDLRMVIDLRSLHTVSGHVSSTAAGQNIVSGRATLIDSVEQALQPAAMIDANGNFSIPFVPTGTYGLVVDGSTQPSRGGFPFPARNTSDTPEVTFQPGKQTVVVGDTDITGLTINLTPAQ